MFKVNHYLIYQKKSSNSIPEDGFITSTLTIKNWINKLTSGIIYDALQYYDKSSDWSKIECWSPDYLPEKGNFIDKDKFHTLLFYNKFINWIENN